MSLNLKIQTILDEHITEYSTLEGVLNTTQVEHPSMFIRNLVKTSIKSPITHKYLWVMLIGYDKNKNKILYLSKEVAEAYKKSRDPSIPL